MGVVAVVVGIVVAVIVVSIVILLFIDLEILRGRTYDLHDILTLVCWSIYSKTLNCVGAQPSLIQSLGLRLLSPSARCSPPTPVRRKTRVQENHSTRLRRE